MKRAEIRAGNLMGKRELEGHKFCDALGSEVRAEIFRELMRIYPERLSIAALKQKMGLMLSNMSVNFHLRKLQQLGLVELDRSGRGFRATVRGIDIQFNAQGFRIIKEG